MIHKFITSLILVASVSCSVFAEGDAYITLHATNKEMMKKSMILTTFKDYLQSNISGVEQIAAPDGTGIYKFHISGIKKFQLFFLNADQNMLIHSYIEAGDDIRIDCSSADAVDVKAENLHFSGKGSTKLIATTRLAFASDRPSPGIALNKKFDRGILDTLVLWVKGQYQSGMQMIQPLKKDISSPVYKMIQTDVYGVAASGVCGYFGGRRKQYASLKDLVDLLADLHRNVPATDMEILSQSASYIDYLIRSGLTVIDLEDIDPRDRPMEMCNALIKMNQGLLREKTLMIYLCRYDFVTKSRNPDQVYAKALEHIKSPFYRNYLTKLAEIRKPGAEAFNFSLPDDKGHVVRLSDFKNKVVMIDNWFTGCTNCAEMAKRIAHEVLPAFINNPDVVFLNVCADRNKAQWLESLQGGKYTHPGSINLFTEGLGESHPFMKKYNFESFPRVILIGRDGRMFSSNMPLKSADMIAKINEALKK
ncbi:Peroxiredoxin [Pedobacter hartonius]|uniref:Peroxiredoxin n=2 Tax=Pedobacter hartonius TaxID=425514 RepID=A0A1H4BWW8_9SPHI|nr:Peroxiredoxin [Pedobacter hartonius]